MWWKLWLIWLAVILGFTMPWTNFTGHSHWVMVRWIPFYDHPLALSDVLANMVLFAPFGFLLARHLSGSSPKRVWVVTLLAAVTLSTSIEFVQVFSHDRIPSTTDIVTNLLGAIFGSMLSKLGKAETISPPSR
jgi:glycopeptide antibiotics resistance protein